GADHLLVVAPVNAPVRVRRLTPERRPAGQRVGRVEQVGAAGLLVGLGREAGEDQVPVLVGEDEAVAGLADRREEGGGPALRAGVVGRGGGGLPAAVA